MAGKACRLLAIGLGHTVCDLSCSTPLKGAHFVIGRFPDEKSFPRLHAVGHNQFKGAIDKRTLFLTPPNTPRVGSITKVCKSYGGQSERFQRSGSVVQEQNGSHLGRRDLLPSPAVTPGQGSPPGARCY